MSEIKVTFSSQKNGYDQDQVDRYVNKLTGEYANLQQKYTDLFKKYDSLTKQSNVGMAAVSKAIVDAEIRAIQIIAEANNEAAQIKGSAHVDLVHMQQEKDRVTNDIFEMINNLKSIVPFGIGEI